MSESNRVYRISPKHDAPSAFISDDRVSLKPFYWWIAANIFGHLLGLGLIGFVGVIFGSPGIALAVKLTSVNDFVVAVLVFSIVGLLDGTLVGLLQELTMRRFMKVELSERWVFATALAGIGAWVGGPLFIGVTFLTLSFCSIVIGAGLSGLIMGLAQGLILRRYFGISNGWEIANTIAGILAFLGVALGSWAWGSIRNIELGGFEVSMVGVAAGAALYGVTTGIPFMRLPRIRRSN